MDCFEKEKEVAPLIVASMLQHVPSLEEARAMYEELAEVDVVYFEDHNAELIQQLLYSKDKLTTDHLVKSFLERTNLISTITFCVLGLMWIRNTKVLATYLQSFMADRNHIAEQCFETRLIAKEFRRRWSYGWPSSEVGSGDQENFRG